LQVVTPEGRDNVGGRRLSPQWLERADLVLLRLPGPARDRLDFIQDLRSHCDLPCVVVSDQGETPAERIAALELGVDEYLLFTMSQPEMIARIHAVLRRAGRVRRREVPAAASQPAAGLQGTFALAGGWHFATQRRALVCNEPPGVIRLTSAEFELLRLLAASGGSPIDRDAISRAVFRRPWQVGDRAVDSLVKRVRQKGPPDLIATVRGCGYALLFAGRAVADPGN
jgi:DNA-binding response OmpR family regulator